MSDKKIREVEVDEGDKIAENRGNWQMEAEFSIRGPGKGGCRNKSSWVRWGDE